MSDVFAELKWDGKKAMLPVIEGSACEHAVDISKLRDQTGLITLEVSQSQDGPHLPSSADLYRRAACILRTS